MATKILIIRFSSIGDIVLTTPVIRCLKQQLEDAELHYVCKDVFKPCLQHNPYLSKIHTFKEDISELYKELKLEKFDLLIDLHKNLRSFRLKQQLKVKTYAFNKLNLQKLAAVRLKKISALPKMHIVDRYLETLESLHVKPDGKGLDYFISEEEKQLPKGFYLPTGKFIGLVIGGSYYTKKIPFNKLTEIVLEAKLPIVLLGGKEDSTVAELLLNRFPNLTNGCGKLSINQSAAVIQQAEWVITSDTGLMHMASAFDKKIISVWGNTIPEFGMGPYQPNTQNKILEIKNLPCRPCSKLGYQKCPKGHFKCMNQIDFSFLKDQIK